MTRPVVGGAVGSGAPYHASRSWGVDGDRMLFWHGPEGKLGNVASPIPGEAEVMACDPWMPPLALLSNGEAWRYWGHNEWNRQWTGLGNLLEGGEMSDDGMGTHRRPTLLRATVERVEGGRRIWAVTTERVVVVLNEHGKPGKPAGNQPVPGRAGLLAIEPGRPGPTVLTDDGTLWLSTPRGWACKGHLTGEGDGKLRVRALRSFCFEVGRDVVVGEEFEVSAEAARDLFARGSVEPVGAP